MKWLRNIFENHRINSVERQLQELKATLEVTRIELFEYLEKVMSPLAKRLAVRISRENKLQESDDTSIPTIQDGFDELRKLNKA